MQFLDGGRPEPENQGWFCFNSPFRDWLPHPNAILDLNCYYLPGMDSPRNTRWVRSGWKRCGRPLLRGGLPLPSPLPAQGIRIGKIKSLWGFFVEALSPDKGQANSLMVACGSFDRTPSTVWLRRTPIRQPRPPMRNGRPWKVRLPRGDSSLSSSTSMPQFHGPDGSRSA